MIGIPHTAKHVLRKFYFCHFGTRAYRRFVIVGHARTGSNFLRIALRQVKPIRIYNEEFADFNRTIGKKFKTIWKRIFQRQPPQIQAVGFKLFYNQLTEKEWKLVADDHDLMVIHLLRRNRLRTLVSLDIAMATNRWMETLSNPSFEAQTIAVDPEAILGRIKQLEAAESKARDRLRSHPTIELFYEDLISEPDKELGKVLSALGLESEIDVERIRLKKQNPRSLSETIENFDAVSQALSGSKYESCLNG